MMNGKYILYDIKKNNDVESKWHLHIDKGDHRCGEKGR